MHNYGMRRRRKLTTYYLTLNTYFIVSLSSLIRVMYC